MRNYRPPPVQNDRPPGEKLPPLNAEKLPPFHELFRNYYQEGISGSAFTCAATSAAMEHSTRWLSMDEAGNQTTGLARETT